MDYMIYIAAISGGIISFALFNFKVGIDLLMTFIGCFILRSKFYYDAFYEVIDNEPTYTSIFKNTIGMRVKSYKDYIKLLDNANSAVRKRFMFYQNQMLKDLLLRVFPILLLPSLIFWRYWYVYLFGVIFVIISMLAYKRFVLRRTFTFNRYVVLSLCFNEYLNGRLE